jgi:hypothetical protein
MESKGDIIITIDDDGEYIPNQIGLLVQKFSESKADIVYGIPNVLKRGSVKMLLYRIYLYNLKRTRENRKSSFRLIGGDFLKKCRLKHSDVINIDKFLLYYNPRINYCVVNYMPGDRSRYSIWGYLRVLYNAIAYKYQTMKE